MSLIVAHRWKVQGNRQEFLSTSEAFVWGYLVAPYNAKEVYKGFLKKGWPGYALTRRRNAELLEEIAMKYCVPKEIGLQVEA